MNMYEKGPMNRAVNNMFHDANTGCAALQVALQHLENECAKLIAEPDTKELGGDLWHFVWQAKQERQVIMDAMDGFYTEFKQDFPDHLKAKPAIKP